MSASGCLYLNYTERLPSRSPDIPGNILPRRVLRSFDLPHSEVLPLAPHIQFWTTSVQDLQLWQGTRSSPSRTANYNPALGCHLHTPLGVLIHHGSRGYVTDVNEVTPHGLTIIGESQEESSLVHDFLLASMIGRYPVCHAGYYRMQVITPQVLELPPLSLKGI